jgi:hypothetical protein
MAIAQKNINSEDDFFRVGPDATATFDDSPSNPTEHAGNENLHVLDSEDEDLDDEDEDEDDEEDDDEEEEIDDDEEEDEDDDHDLGKGPQAPSIYRRL